MSERRSSPTSDDGGDRDGPRRVDQDGDGPRDAVVEAGAGAPGTVGSDDASEAVGDAADPRIRRRESLSNPRSTSPLDGPADRFL